MYERSNIQRIEEYLDLANEFDISPFEHHHSMHLRDILEEEKNNLTFKETQLLKKADEMWIQNAEKLVKHISRIWDFDNNKMPENHWWWHLSKFVEKDEKK